MHRFHFWFLCLSVDFEPRSRKVAGLLERNLTGCQRWRHVSTFQELQVKRDMGWWICQKSDERPPYSHKSFLKISKFLVNPHVLRFFHHVGNLDSSSLDALRAKTSQSLPERAKSKLWHPLHLKLRRTRDFSQLKLGFLCSKILNKWIGLVEHLQETIFCHPQAGSFS